MPGRIHRETSETEMVDILRGLVEQIKPEVRAIQNVQTRIVNLLNQPTLGQGCCAEILAFYVFPLRDKSFTVLKAALNSGGLKDSEMKRLLTELPDDKRHLFEPLFGVRSFDFYELSQMSSIPFHTFFQTLKTHAEGCLPPDLNKLYHRIPEKERTPANQQKLGDLVAYVFLYKNVKYQENEDENQDTIKSLQHLLQNLPDWNLKK